MAIITTKNKYRAVILPAGKAERGRFLKSLREQAPAWLKKTWAHSKHEGTHRLTMPRIDGGGETAVRKRRAKKN